jgi:hypothetical protein
LSFRFFTRCFAIATRFLLFIPSFFPEIRTKPGYPRLRGCCKWLRRLDSNQRPSGYEPDELPLLHSAIRLYPRSGIVPTGAAQCVGLGEGLAGGVGDGLTGVVTRNVRSFGLAKPFNRASSSLAVPEVMAVTSL